MANSVDPDQTPRSWASDLGRHCLQRPICPNTVIQVYVYRECKARFARAKYFSFVFEKNNNNKKNKKKTIRAMFRKH